MKVDISEFTTAQGRPLTKKRLTQILSDTGYHHRSDIENPIYRFSKTGASYEVLEVLKWSVVARKIGRGENEPFPIDYFKRFFAEIK